jgi:hypothetical protein
MAGFFAAIAPLSARADEDKDSRHGRENDVACTIEKNVRAGQIFQSISS